MKSKILILTMLVVSLAGCSWLVKPAPTAVPEPTAIPEPTLLTMVVHPSDEAEASREQYALLVAHLERELGIEIELFVAADYAAAAQAMMYGWADIGRVNPPCFVAVKNEGADIEPVVTGIKKKTGTHFYNGLIVTRADSGITDLNGKTFAFVDPMSTSGGLLPSLYIKDNDIELGEVFYAGSHPSVILAVKNGTVDAGAIADNRYYTAIEDDVIAEDEFTILWTSEPVPNNPIVVQSSLSDDLKSRIQAAFLSVPQDIAEHCSTGEIGYAKIQDSDYDITRRLVEASNE